MMLHYIKSEWKKASKIQAVFITFIFLAISSFIGLGIYFANREVLEDGTQSLVLWGQLTFYYSQVLFAPMVAILTAIIMMPEFERNTLSMLKANNISISGMLKGKFFVVFALLIPVQVMLFVVYVSGMATAHIQIDHSVFVNVRWLLISMVASIPLIFIQYYICVKTRSFGQAVGISSLGAMGGFVILFINQNIGYIYSYSLPMIALRSRKLVDFSPLEFVFFIFVCLIYAMTFYHLTKKELMRK